MVTAAAPASCTIRASSGALRDVPFQPARILTVTGILTAFAMALTTAAACSGSRIRLHPAWCFAIFGTGHPMLMSTISAPMLSTTCAAAAILSGSPPKIWIETGRSSSVYSAYSRVRSIPRTRPSDETISVTTRPQPPWRLTRRRNAVSVIPAIGATTNGDGSVTLPIFTSIGPDICRVHVDADRLSDQVDRQHEPRFVAFPQQPTSDALQRAVNHFDHHPFADQRTGIEREVALHELTNGVNFVLGNRRRLTALRRDDRHDAAALQHRQPLPGIEPRETIPGKQRPVDLLPAVLPAAPARYRWQECFDVLVQQLLAHHLLVPRARPQGVPLQVLVDGRRDPVAVAGGRSPW